MADLPNLDLTKAIRRASPVAADVGRSRAVQWAVIALMTIALIASAVAVMRRERNPFRGAPDAS
jgi:hypothetical protein